MSDIPAIPSPTPAVPEVIPPVLPEENPPALPDTLAPEETPTPTPPSAQTPVVAGMPAVSVPGHGSQHEPGQPDALILDEPDMASGSPVKAPSQQSVRSYIDSKTVGKIDLPGDPRTGDGTDAPRFAIGIDAIGEAWMHMEAEDPKAWERILISKNGQFLGNLQLADATGIVLPEWVLARAGKTLVRGDGETAGGVPVGGLNSDGVLLCHPGDNLVEAYAQAKALTPSGRPRSATNRVTIFLMPGEYPVGDDDWTIDAPFIDIVALGSSSKKASAFYGSPGFISYAAGWTNAMIVGLFADHYLEGSGADAVFINCQDPEAGWGERGWIGSNPPSIAATFIGCRAGDGAFSRAEALISGTYIDCEVGENSFVADYGGMSGTFIDCKASHGSFVAKGGDPFGGTFINCIAGNFSFYGEQCDISGAKFRNCVAGNSSFGADNISGTFENCIAGNISFVANSNALGGTLDRCRAGNNSFRGEGSGISATLRDCIAQNNSFTTSTGSVNGTFIRCEGGSACFGGEFVYGKYHYCIGGNGSFQCANEGDQEGKYYFCQLLAGTFQEPTGNGRIRFCIDGNDAIQDAVDP